MVFTKFISLYIVYNVVKATDKMKWSLFKCKWSGNLVHSYCAMFYSLSILFTKYYCMYLELTMTK